MITVTHLTKSYGRRTVVDDLSFQLAAGRITVIGCWAAATVAIGTALLIRKDS